MGTPGLMLSNEKLPAGLAAPFELIYKTPGKTWLYADEQFYLYALKPQ